jgi:hypothetical protein
MQTRFASYEVMLLAAPIARSRFGDAEANSPLAIT